MNESLPPTRHVPILTAEILALAKPVGGEIWVDATVGGGGHTRALAECVGPSGLVIGIEQDPALADRARERLAGLPVVVVNDNFERLRPILTQQGRERVAGVLADLGVCSDQLDDPAYGLSFQRSGPLDMRLDPQRGSPASELVARLPERELADLFWEYGEERHSRRIARRLVEARAREPIATTEQFADLVRRAMPGKRTGIDPATRVFQALRIAVNDELGALSRLLKALPMVLQVGGRAAIISFHSLEDRPVKQTFRGPGWEALTRKPVQASDDEQTRNSRSRSAKLRVAVWHGEPEGG